MLKPQHYLVQLGRMVDLSYRPLSPGPKKRTYEYRKSEWCDPTLRWRSQAYIYTRKGVCYVRYKGSKDIDAEYPDLDTAIAATTLKLS